MIKDSGIVNSQSGGQGFIGGLNERLRTLIGIQQSQEDGYIRLSPETNRAIETEIARIKRSAKKMEKEFEKIDNKQAKGSSQMSPQNGGRN